MIVSPSFKDKVYGALLMGATFALDQATKLTIRFDVLPSPTDSITVCPVFDLVHALNYGVSFSLFAGHDETRRFALIGVTLAITIAVMIAFLRETKRLPLLAYGLVMGGAIGNVFDRVEHKAVFDFLSFHIGAYRWPAFNLADSAIVLGVGLLLLDGYWSSRAQKTES